MGRTRRIRIRKSEQGSIPLLLSEEITNLCKWLKSNSWRNETKLALKMFAETGRGVFSKKAILPGSPFISIPFQLMITFDTVHKRLLELYPKFEYRLSMHELLCLFLILESEHTGSFWKYYIDSLPEKVPALPWLCSEEELRYYPDTFLEMYQSKRKNFNDSSKRVRSIMTNYNMCKWDKNLFKWSYVLVNTRAVYVDPSLFNPRNNMLLDEPCMALCPFLDMFNHNYTAVSEAFTISENGSDFFQLKTPKRYRKFEQIFISYGSHNNEKLMMEYGFFIKGNNFDVAKFDFQEILKVLRISLDREKIKFIQDHGIVNDLYIGISGPSFNMKALLFLCSYKNYSNLAYVIFSDNYPINFSNDVQSSLIILLNFKKLQYTKDYRNLAPIVSPTENCILFQDFLFYRISFLNDLIKIILHHR